MICIANDFTRYDEHAVNQMQRNIKLVKYRFYGKGLVLFEHLNAPIAKPVMDASIQASSSKTGTDKTFLQQYAGAPQMLQNLYDSIKGYVLSLGDDITENQLKLYVAFRKVKNIICAEIYPSKILLHLRLNPDEVALENGYARDMHNIGHFGTGDLQITVKSVEDFERAKPLLDKAYNEN